MSGAMTTIALMADPVRPTDPTASIESVETAYVPSSAPTESAQAAWSGAVDDLDIPDIQDIQDIQDDPQQIPSEPADAGQSWGTTWGRAGALVMFGLGLAMMIVVVGWVLTSTPPKNTQPSATQAAPQTTTAPATSAPPATIASTPDQDSKYIKALNDRGISFANPEAAVYNGKLVCQNYRAGMTVDQIVAAFRASNPSLSNSANDYVTISMRTYCP
jgi:hypothetical protein